MGRTCEPHATPVLVEPHLIWMYPCIGGRNSLCNHRRKQHCELSVFWLNQILMRGFQTPGWWLLLQWQTGLLQRTVQAQGISTFNRHFQWGGFAFATGCVCPLVNAQLCALGLGLTGLTRQVFKEGGQLGGYLSHAAGLTSCRGTPWTMVSERHNPSLPRRL